MDNNNWEYNPNLTGETSSAWNDGNPNPDLPWATWQSTTWKTDWEFGDEFEEDEDDMHMLHLIVGSLRRYLMPKQIRNNGQPGWQYVSHVFMGHPDAFVDEFRMRKEVFIHIVDTLVAGNYLSVGQNARVSVYESFAIFIQTCGKGHRFRDSQGRFQHSNETVHRHFVKCLEALVQFAPLVITPPDFSKTHSRITCDRRFSPYFLNCVGAIDGTHIPASIRKHKQAAWYNRKGVITQNVLAICDFDGLFTYVYPGWEGSAHDSRVMKDAEEYDVNYPHPPPGKFYLVDSGYTNRDGYQAPYRNVMYHVPQWAGIEPAGPIQLFNKRHASLRNIIERAFGMLKRRFPILKGSMPSFTIKRQVQIVTACCVVHNLVKRFDAPDKYSDPPTAEEDADLAFERMLSTSWDAETESSQSMGSFRDMVAHAMWEDRHG